MKTDNATRMLSDLRQLIDRWELELGAQPLWWRKHSAIESGGAIAPVATEARKKVSFQRPSSRKIAAGSKASAKPTGRSDEASPKNHSHPAATTGQ
jgi:hypothetical protein